MSRMLALTFGAALLGLGSYIVFRALWRADRFGR